MSNDLDSSFILFDIINTSIVPKYVTTVSMHLYGTVGPKFRFHIGIYFGNAGFHINDI